MPEAEVHRHDERSADITVPESGPDERLDKYLTAFFPELSRSRIQEGIQEEEVTVDDRVTELVTFRRHDLTDGDPAGEFDLVVCRNLFIYIEERAKETMVSTLRTGLRPRGYLVVGLTETLPPAHRGEFEPVDRRRRVYRQRG